MHWRPWLVLAFALGLSGAPEQVASFDCKLAVRPEEKAVCASPELGAVDKEMADPYRKALRPLSSKAAGLMRDDQKR